MHIPILSAIDRAVFALMNAIYLRRRLRIKRPKTARLEFVDFDSPWAVVYPVVIRNSLVSGLLAAVAGAFVAIAIFVWQAVQDLGAYLHNPSAPNWWLALAAVLLVAPPVAIVTWWFTEWNRKNKKYIVFTHAAFVVQVEAPFGVPYVSWGPTTLVEEQIISSAAERAGQKNPSLLGQLYDGILWLWKGAANIFLPSRVFGAADRWKAPEEAWGRSRALQNIAGRAQEDKLLREVVFRKLAEARLEDAKASESWFGRPNKAQEVLDAYNRLIVVAGVETEWFDLTDPDLVDPGLWGPDGEPTEAAPAIQTAEAPPAISFPEA